MTRRRWNRRQFLVSSAAALCSSHVPVVAQSGSTASKQPYSAATSPEVIRGGIHPLLIGGTERPMRYLPEGADFVARNGQLFFNRPIYGPISSFRVDAGDLPEFSLYLPGHGGNLKLGIISERGTKWFAEAAEVVARYRPGRMIYEIQDPLLSDGTVHLELLTAAEGSAMMLQIDAKGIPEGISLAWAFAGASGRKGSRNGDIGCESQPITQFFQVRPDECAGNEYQIEASSGTTRKCHLHSAFCDLTLTFPASADLAVADFEMWNKAPMKISSTAGEKTRLAILTGSLPFASATRVYIEIRHIRLQETSANPTIASAFADRSRQVEDIAARLKLNTPDPYLNAVGPAISVAADALWDPHQECVMHGCVAWRVALAGWRGPYCLDALGHHDRAIKHFRHWIAKQNITPVASETEATGPPDPRSHLTRKEAMLHTNGDLSRNHYDMNLVFFDVLLRHLRWTGDLEFARETWPAFERHLAWERRLFRRIFTGKDGKELPLYEAYAAIWASDNLQYNGGGVAHSSAYNIFALRFAALLAGLLNRDPAPYEREAALIEQAMQQHLWISEQGAFAESKDLLGPQTVYHNPALWTVYHTIDSEIPSRRQAWQIAAERLAMLRRIPVHGAGVPDGGYLLSCTDWLPYMWSLNLIVLAEDVHMVLAMWQAGMTDEAYLLLKGNLLDSMYQGKCPGNFHLTSQLDDHRQEAQRDFGDPIGIASRAVIEGLFGFQPDLIKGHLIVRPGFPSDWEHASMEHPDFDFSWNIAGMTEKYALTSRLPKAVRLRLVLRARTTTLPVVKSGGKTVPCAFDPAAVGSPVVTVELPAAASWSLTVQWKGEIPTRQPAIQTVALGDKLKLPHGVAPAHIDDPQHCLNAGKVIAAGFHTVFANMRHGDCRWSLPISFEAKKPAPPFARAPVLPKSARIEPLDLSGTLKHQINEIFTRPYLAPRSPFCSLAIPEQIQGGWANFTTDAHIDDAGLRRAGGVLNTPLGVSFRTPEGTAPNCLFLSYWEQDQSSIELPLKGRAAGVYLLMAGSTLPQMSRMQHGVVTVAYRDGGSAALPLQNPETWWPIEQDYLLDDYMFVNDAPLPLRVDLSTGKSRVLDPIHFKGQGRSVPGGSATVLYLPLDGRKELLSMNVQVDLYGIVVALLAVTLMRSPA